MNKNTYLTTSPVKNFLCWLETMMDKQNSFNHCFIMKKPIKSWECESLYSAYENYSWPFKYKHPIYEKTITGSTFNDSAESLKNLSELIKQSIDNSNHDICRKTCLSILEWGGVLAKNDIKVKDLGTDICEYLRDVRNRINSNMSLDQYYIKEIIINSGFTKIYSLCIDDFIIYDGRVGAALGLLVRKFCEDFPLEKVPEELAFAWGKGKESVYKNSSLNKRNPSKSNYFFPELLNNPKRHLENNIRANWLLKELLNKTDSKFKKLENDIQTRALEASLFMIGYDVSE